MRETDYQELIYKRTYSRWVSEEMRREEWPESVNRFRRFFQRRVPGSHWPEFLDACDLITHYNVMPSMRALWAAGVALERENIAAYNCCYMIIDHIKAFADLLYILMNGTGVGFSIERQYINRLPEVPKINKSDEVIVFADSKRGWAEGFYRVLKALYSGNEPAWDLSRIRPKGSILKTFGGRASGPEPLDQLLKYAVRMLKNAQGRKLNSLECHDLCCFVASCVIVGGVRRSACISLSNLSDERMAGCKRGEFWATEPQRSLANNSVAYTEKPSAERFLREWLTLVESKTGERGIFNREAARFQAALTGRRDTTFELGCNPCGEILLRPMEFCNLTEVILRPEDDKIAIMDKVRAATIIGCVQATLTDFGFISKRYKKNCEEERLLGVSLTGLRDHPILSRETKKARLLLHEMKEYAFDTAKEWSSVLGISMPKAITCVKPSGTVSQLVGSSSGLHPRYADYYIRRVRITAVDPLAKLLVDQGYPWQPEVGETHDNCRTMVFDFPQKSPDNAILNEDVSAIDQLKYWKMIKEVWCEHNPSCTIFVKDEEWPEVGAWVYKNWNYICGVSFLPADTGIYQLAPYEEIDEETYHQMVESLPDIDWSRLSEFETCDHTEGSREIACTGGACEI